MGTRGKTRFAPLVGIALIGLTAGACRTDAPDAYGNFEATEVRTSAELSGQLLWFDAVEGASLAQGSAVGQVDTVALALQREELLARRGAARTRTAEAVAQVAVLQAQLLTAQDEYRRTLRLFQSEAATARQLNQAEGEVRVLRERIAAARAQTAGSQEETGGAEARIEQLSDQIRRGRVVNPLAGTVLATYVEAGEFVQRGQPLYTIAALDTLTLRAYVSGAQLAAVRIGAPARVRIDGPDGEPITLPGRIVWVSSRAEFTPTPIQTRDERTDQVYAVRIRVPNPGGAVKIGMPGEVVFRDD
jgi:HlyD family secretion protein